MLSRETIRRTLSPVIDTIEVWKANNVTRAQMVAIFKGRKIWLRVLKNFRELEGSWPRALKKMSKIFQGKLVKKSGHPES